MNSGKRAFSRAIELFPCARHFQPMRKLGAPLIALACLLTVPSATLARAAQTSQAQEVKSKPAMSLPQLRARARASVAAATEARAEADRATRAANVAYAQLSAARMAVDGVQQSQSIRSTTSNVAAATADQQMQAAQADVDQARRALAAAQSQTPLFSPGPGAGTNSAGPLMAQVNETAAQMQLTMAQQRLAEAQSRASSARADAASQQELAPRSAAARDSLQQAQQRYDRLASVARIAETKAEQYEAAATEAQRQLDRATSGKPAQHDTKQTGN